MDDIRFRREVVLKALDDHNKYFDTALAELKTLKDRHDEQIQSGKELLGKWQHLFFKAFWEVLQLRRHVSAEILEQVRVDLHVNGLDPDFSFERALEEMLGEKFSP